MIKRFTNLWLFYLLTLPCEIFGSFFIASFVHLLAKMKTSWCVWNMELVMWIPVCDGMYRRRNPT